MSTNKIQWYKVSEFGITETFVSPVKGGCVMLSISILKEKSGTSIAQSQTFMKDAQITDFGADFNDVPVNF